MSDFYLNSIDSEGNAPSVEENEKKMRQRLHGLVDEIITELIDCAPDNRQELLSGFVSELFMSAAKQSIREERYKKQTEGIAKAKAKGVSFGRKSNPLPEKFEEARQLWMNRELPLKEAAKYCGMPDSTFYDTVRRLNGSTVGHRKPLPENFEESRLLWRSHKLKMKEAAARCGMATTTFYDAVKRVESAEARE
ncbi:hypothetical protein D5272_12775 [bacterium D16-76]|nr:hypothetical protein [bacterium D16-76]